MFLSLGCLVGPDRTGRRAALTFTQSESTTGRPRVQELKWKNYCTNLRCAVFGGAMNQPRSGTRGSLLRRLNEREILEAIQTAGPLSRAEVARHTRISSPTVTRTVTALLRARLLEEGDFRQPALGRPGKVLRLASKTASVLGLVVGARRCELASAGLDGRITVEESVAFDTPTRYAALVRAVARQARRLIGRQNTQVMGLGVSVPGLLNRREKRTVFSPNLHQTDGRRLGEDLQEALQIADRDPPGITRPLPGRAVLRGGPRRRRLRHAGHQRGSRRRRGQRRPHPGGAQRTGRRTRPRHGGHSRQALRLRQQRLSGDGGHRHRPGGGRVGAGGPGVVHRRGRAAAATRRSAGGRGTEPDSGIPGRRAWRRWSTCSTRASCSSTADCSTRSRTCSRSCWRGRAAAPWRRRWRTARSSGRGATSGWGRWRRSSTG